MTNEIEVQSLSVRGAWEALAAQYMPDSPSRALVVAITRRVPEASEAPLSRSDATDVPTHSETLDPQESFSDSAVDAAERFADVTEGSDTNCSRLRVKMTDGRFVTLLFGIGDDEETADRRAGWAIKPSSRGPWVKTP